MIDKNNITTYACINNNINVRKSSSSGGCFYEIAKYIIKNNGIVFAAKFDENFHVVHDSFDNIKGIYRYMGSKYAPSKLGNTFKLIKENLEEGRLVMFSGTPCQNNGLTNFLKKKYDNLIQIDFICHGMPSAKVWDKYLQILKEKGNIKSIQFRNKDNGWANYQFKVEYDDGNTFCENHNSNIYMQGFLADLYLNSSCYNCKSKGFNRTSDITMADLWGADTIMSSLNDDNGISALFVNTEKGHKLFDKINTNLSYEKVDINSITKCNPSYYKIAPKHKNNQKFMAKLDKTGDIEKLIKRSLYGSLLRRFLRKIKHIVKRMLRRL